LTGAYSSTHHGRRVGLQGPSNLRAAGSYAVGETLPVLPRPRDFHCSSDSRARVDVQAASQQACAGEKGGAAAGERGEGRVRFVDFFFFLEKMSWTAG